ncbi:MAG: delta endotoxin C-terminal domain-containing protein, partial [Pseudomonadota bacterium]
MADGTITIEAEDMTMDDFQVVSGDNASGGELVKITDGDGVLQTDFEGASGTYDFTISVQDESDGESTLYIVIDGEHVGTIQLDGNNDGGGSNNGGFTDITIEGLEIPAGAEIKIYADQNCGEFCRIDKIELDPVHVDDPEPMGDEVCLLEETFDNCYLESSENVVSSDFRGEGGMATTNGWYDGALELAEVDFTGLTHGTITFDAGVIYGSFESTGVYRDFFKVELVLDDGTVIVLDTFKGDGSTLVGSETGQVLDYGLEQLTYDVPEGIGAASLRFSSMISADCEKIGIDNIVIKAKEPPVDPSTLEAFDNTYEIDETGIIGDGSGQLVANLIVDED